MQAEQFGYRKSHFFFRFRQNSHAVETRLLLETCPSRSFPAAPVSGLSDLDALLLIVAVLVDDTELALSSVRWEATGVGWPLLGCTCDCDDGGGGACEEDTVGFRRNRPSWPRKLAPLSDGRLAAAALFVMMRFVRLFVDRRALNLPRRRCLVSAHGTRSRAVGCTRSRSDDYNLGQTIMSRLDSDNGLFGNVWGMGR